MLPSNTAAAGVHYSNQPQPKLHLNYIQYSLYAWIKLLIQLTLQLVTAERTAECPSLIPQAHPF